MPVTTTDCPGAPGRPREHATGSNAQEERQGDRTSPPTTHPGRLKDRDQCHRRRPRERHQHHVFRRYPVGQCATDRPGQHRGDGETRGAGARIDSGEPVDGLDVRWAGGWRTPRTHRRPRRTETTSPRSPQAWRGLQRSGTTGSSVRRVKCRGIPHDDQTQVTAVTARDDQVGGTTNHRTKRRVKNADNAVPTVPMPNTRS